MFANDGRRQVQARRTRSDVCKYAKNVRKWAGRQACTEGCKHMRETNETANIVGVWDRLYNPKNRTRPKCYVRLEMSELTRVIQDMNKPSTNCDTLLERTTFALDDEEMRLCLVSTQQSNLELCIKCAIESAIIVVWQLSWLKERMPDNHLFVNTKKDAIIRVLQPLEAATIIVLEYSAFLLSDKLKRSDNKPEHVDSPVDYYLKSPTLVAVENVAKEISRQGYKKEELGKKILEFILENLYSVSHLQLLSAVDCIGFQHPFF
ncbi:hypothetical protein EDB19DRAFT_1999185 [Suillus lakei]|nr:hypothetical protein EDB19DRAFT_1999185 [Suillus lakei]